MYPFMPTSNSPSLILSSRTATFWFILNLSLFSCCICCFKKLVSAGLFHSVHASISLSLLNDFSILAVSSSKDFIELLAPSFSFLSIAVTSILVWYIMSFWSWTV